MPPGPVGEIGVQVHAQLARQLADRRLGERVPGGLALRRGRGSGCRRRGAAAGADGAATAAGRRRGRRRPVSRPRSGRGGRWWARRARSRRAPPRARRARLRLGCAVRAGRLDLVGTPGLHARVPVPSAAVAVLDRRRRTARGCRGDGGGSVGRRGAVRVGVDLDDRRPDVDGLAGLHQEARHDAGPRARQVDQRLRGLDLDDRLVHLDGVADGDVPGDDLGLGQALARVRERELLEGRHDGLLRRPASGRRRRGRGRARAGSRARSWPPGTGCGTRRRAGRAPPGGRSSPR